MFRELSTAVKRTFNKKFLPFPAYGDRDGWNRISAEFRNRIIKEAENYVGYTWPLPPASVYLEYARNGNRSRYEDIIFNRRRLPLIYLSFAECIEGKGRFTDDIINGVWTTLDEASWVIPAHNGNAPLPDIEKPVIVDLFSGECAGILSFVVASLSVPLDAAAPQITARIRAELAERIFIPIVKNNYWWTGIDTDIIPNNWNPWIIANILTSVCFASPENSTEVIERCLECLDNFVKGYAPDGGCDEGPAYWTVAGACLFDCIDIIHDITDGEINLFRNEFIFNVCSYICKMHVDGNYYVNYADADAKMTPDAHHIYRMGKMTENEDLKAFAAALYGQKKDKSHPGIDGCSALMYRQIKKLFCNDELSKLDNGFPYVSDAWFEGIQVMSSRTDPRRSNGLFLSAKGGNNNESHNHNDIGSFVIYCDGKPAVIDIGRGEYVRQTFSDKRYDILQMQSGYHNLPIIGGIMQKDGKQYFAENVIYRRSDTRSSLELNLKNAYPEEAQIAGWTRKYAADKAIKTVEIHDTFRLNAQKGIEFVFMTAVKPKFFSNSFILKIDEETSVIAEFDNSLVPSAEIFDTSHDRSLYSNWGEQIYRIILKTGKAVREGDFVFLFHKA